MSRYFQVAKGFEDQGINLPQRQTAHAAGYDFEASEDVTINPVIWQWFKALVVRPRVSAYEFEQADETITINSIESIETMPLEDADGLDSHEQENELTPWRKALKPVLVPTGVKARMEEQEALMLYNRSSNPLKNFLFLANGVGVIDSDYYENEDNDGHIMFQFINFGLFPVTIKKGQRIGQGVFQNFLKTDEDVLHDTGVVRKGGHGSTK